MVPPGFGGRRSCTRYGLTVSCARLGDVWYLCFFSPSAHPSSSTFVCALRASRE